MIQDGGSDYSYFGIKEVNSYQVEALGISESQIITEYYCLIV